MIVPVTAAEVFLYGINKINKIFCNRSGVQGSAFKGYQFDGNLYIFTMIRSWCINQDLWFIF